jgi:hypothetical protein
MYNNSNLRWPPKKTSANRKCNYPNLRWPFKNKMSAKKNYFTIYFIYLKHIMSDSIYLYHSASLFPSAQSVPLSSSHQLLTFPFFTTPIHNISTLVSITALDRQHHLKPLHSLLVRCAAMLLWSILSTYYTLISWFINVIAPRKIHTFIHRWSSWY